MELGEYRAVKRTPLACGAYLDFLREASILQAVRAPGIPKVYGVEKDWQYAYLIEEFLEGDSLSSMVSDMEYFSQAMTIRYGIAICRLISVLHTASPNAVLHLDLHPKNLIIHNDKVNLIDFDQASFVCHRVRKEEPVAGSVACQGMRKEAPLAVGAEDTGQERIRCGVSGFAAPELYTQALPDERTDIYAIGAVLYYMLTGERPGGCVTLLKRRVGYRLRQIIFSCLRRNPARRFRSVDQLYDRLCETGANFESGISSLTVAVAGSRPGVGTTHVAMGLTAYLRSCGFFAVYQEMNGSGAVRQFASMEGAVWEEERICMVHGLPMVSAGTDAKEERLPYEVVVRDYGSGWQDGLRQKAEFRLLVCGAKPWEWKTSGEAVRSLDRQPGLAIVYNLFCGCLSRRLIGRSDGAAEVLMPFFANPLRRDRAAWKVYGRLWQMWTASV